MGTLPTFNPQNMKRHSAMQEHVELMIFIDKAVLRELIGQVS